MSSATRVLLVAGLALTLSEVAHADDTLGSSFAVTTDAPLQFEADGVLVINDDNLNGINNGPGEGVNPATFLHIPGFDGHWSFDLWFTVEDWDMPVQPGVIDGAHNTQIVLRGFHHTAPHADELPNNFLPPIFGGENVLGVISPADIRFGSGALLAASGTHPHGDHLDWYRVRSNDFAHDPIIAPYDAADPNERRQVRGAFDIAASHPEDGDPDPWPDHGSIGATPTQGSRCAFDPITGILTIEMGRVDILDTDGGRTGTIAPEFVADPLVGIRSEPMHFVLADSDGEPGAVFVWRPDPQPDNADPPIMYLNPDADIAIGVKPGELRITSTLAGDTLGNHAPFTQLWVIDSAEPDAWRSAWAEQFVRQGWFGEGLSDAEQQALVYPALTITTDIDLVEATQGFTRPAELPATVLITMLTSRGVDCFIDFNADGVLDFFDVQIFLGLFSDQHPAADLNHDGAFDFFDIQQFLQAFADGCP